jgi:hypothetical protein
MKKFSYLIGGLALFISIASSDLTIKKAKEFRAFITWMFCLTLIPEASMGNSGIAALSDLRMERSGESIGLIGIVMLVLFLVSCAMVTQLSDRLLLIYWIVGVCISYVVFATNWYLIGLSIIPEIDDLFSLILYLFFFALGGFILIGPIAFLHGWLTRTDVE